MVAFVYTFQRKPHYPLVFARLQAMEGVDPVRGKPRPVQGGVKSADGAAVHEHL